MAAFQHPVVNLENKPAGTVDLLPEVFKLEDLNQHLIWEAVRHFLTKRRAGTAKTKDKWEVSGSGRKLWKQKGTGRARVGSIRSPLWKGGGTTHGPHPRSYDYAFPKRARRSALRNALSVKSLASLLQQAGAVRAMQLDINIAWISFMWYSPGPTARFTTSSKGISKPTAWSST